MTKNQNKQNLPETIPELPPEELKQFAAVVAKIERFKGPLPHPQILKQYDEVVPGSAMMIIGTFEKQSNHRMNLESTVVTGNDKMQKLGLIVAALINICAITAAVIMTLSGDATPGAFTFLGTLIADVTVFFGSKSKQQKELRAKKNGS
jgi:uncharacterized membrane protein